MRKFLFALIGTLGVSALLSAQTVSVGVLGGFPFNDPTATTTTTTPTTTDESAPYIIGGSVEVKFHSNFAIEADALFRPIGNTLSFKNAPLTVGLTGTTAFISRERGKAWEFPLLGKYYFHEHSKGWSPFVGAGFSLRTTGFTSVSTQTTQLASGQLVNTTATNTFRSNLNVGATGSAGISIRRGRMAVTPEVRYTRWGRVDNQMVSNDLKFLLGVSF